MSATNDLVTNYQHVISDLTLTMGDKGAFEVSVDGELIYSKQATGRHAQPGEVLERFAELVGPEVKRYGE